MPNDRVSAVIAQVAKECETTPDALELETLRIRLQNTDAASVTTANPMAATVRKLRGKDSYDDGAIKNFIFKNRSGKTIPGLIWSCNLPTEEFKRTRAKIAELEQTAQGLIGQKLMVEVREGEKTLEVEPYTAPH